MVGWIGMILRVFFWWWNGNEPIQDDPTWIIKEIAQTGENQISTGNNEIISNQTWIQLPDEILEIRVMMPRYFYTAGRKNFAQDLYTQQKIYIKFNFTDNLNVYKSFVYNSNFDEADLILIPYDRIENVPVRTFTFQQNLNTVFDQLISPIVSNERTTFLPFAADPVVMYTLNWYESPSNFWEIVRINRLFLPLNCRLLLFS